MIHKISGNNFHGEYAYTLRGAKAGFILSARQVANMDQPFTTLREIRGHRPCGMHLSGKGEKYGYLKLSNFLGSDFADDAPITVDQIVESNYFDDALWCLRSMPKWDDLWRHFAVDCAERVVKTEARDDVKKVLVVARLFALGLATVEELDVARSAASAEVSAAASASAAREAEIEWQKSRLLALCAAGEWSPVSAI